MELHYQEQICEAAEREKHANEAKTEYLVHLNQEVRGLVDGIRGTMETSRRYAQDPGKQEQCRRDVNRATQFLLDVIDNIPGMVPELYTGRPAAPRKVFNMRQLYKETADLIENLAQEIGVSVEKRKLSGTHTQVIGNPLYTRQMMQYMSTRIIKNKYMGKKFYIACMELSADTDSVTYQFVCDTAENSIQENKKSEFELLITLDLAEESNAIYVR